MNNAIEFPNEEKILEREIRSLLKRIRFCYESVEMQKHIEGEVLPIFLEAAKKIFGPVEFDLGPAKIIATEPNKIKMHASEGFFKVLQKPLSVLMIEIIRLQIELYLYKQYDSRPPE